LQEGKSKYLRAALIASAVLSFLVVGWVTIGNMDEEKSGRKETTLVGSTSDCWPVFSSVLKSGAQVECIDVRHSKIPKRICVKGDTQGELFGAKFSPGEYNLFWIQIREGPLRSKA